MESQESLSATHNVIITTNTTSAAATTVEATMYQQQPQQPGFSYILFLHREELRKRKASCMRISHTKFQLTHELITKTVKNIHKCSRDDLQILSRETIFKKNLRRQIARMRCFELMQMAKYQKQQNDKFQEQLQQPQPQQNWQSHQSGNVEAMEIVY